MIQKNKKLFINVIILLCILASYLIYTRPQTIEQRYPLLDISDCTEIAGYYFEAPAVEDTEFHIRPEDSRFSELVQLIQSAELKKNFNNFLPQGTKSHLLADGDFKWELLLNFDAVSFPNGDQGRGYMLHLRNFFGDFSVSFDGDQIWYSISNQDQWLKEIMEVISE